MTNANNPTGSDGFNLWLFVDLCNIHGAIFRPPQ